VSCPNDEIEERDIIMSLDTYVIIEYIKSSVDIILNLKFEEIEKRLLDKNANSPMNDSFKHAKRVKEKNPEDSSNAMRSSIHSSISQVDGPP